MLHLFIVAIIFFESAFARVNIPTNLNSTDRERALQILGLGSSTKILTDPYPLGGYSGFEMGLSLESIAIDEVSRLGASANSQNQLMYPMISLGKGVYNNIDFYFNFIPYNESTSLSSYGGFIRWGFYQMKYFPACFSLIGHVNTSNINNQIIMQGSGMTLMSGVNLPNFSFYIGLGSVQSIGEFVGGANGVTIENINRTETVQSFQSIIGGVYHLGDFFLALEMDQYTQPTYSLKLGYRE